MLSNTVEIYSIPIRGISDFIFLVSTMVVCFNPENVLEKPVASSQAPELNLFKSCLSELDLMLLI